MIHHIKIFTLILLCIGGIYNIAHSQTLYKVVDNKESDIKVSGTSTLHDWEMNSYSTAGKAEFELNSDNAKELVSVQSLSFSLLVSNLKSDNKGMDKNAYEALKSDEHAYIEYTLTSSTLSTENGRYLIKSVGNLTIAGLTKEIKIDVHTTINKNNTITCKGSYPIKMTDYDVTPPSFMWGAMKTGDAITLDFVVVYEKTEGTALIN